MKKHVSAFLAAILLLAMAPLSAFAQTEETSSSPLLDYDLAVENVTVVRCVPEYQGISGLCVSGFLANRGLKSVQVSKNQVSLLLSGKKITQAYFEDATTELPE